MRVLIVDDEPPARANLIHLLRLSVDQLEIHEAENGQVAREALKKFRPEIMFLDVQMPGLNGLDLMRNVPEPLRPVTIFVTAYRDFAVDAFEFAAADYLVKPFRRLRFSQSLQRALALVEQRTFSEQNADWVCFPPTSSDPPKLRIKEGHRTAFVALNEIYWVQSAGNFVELHLARETPLIRTSLRCLEDALTPSGFIRIHRKILVNLAHVRELRLKPSGDYLVFLDDGSTLPLSRHRKQALAQLRNPS